MSDMLTQRSLRTDDAAAITEILDAMERAEPVDEAYDEQDIIEELTAPGVDLPRASVGIVDNDRLVAFGWLRINSTAPQWKAYQWAGVHPDHVRRGFGRRLLAELESRAQAVRDADAPRLPGELKVWLDQRRPGAAALAAAAGYQTWRYFVRMRADLRRPVVGRPVPANVEIRRYRATDDEAVRSASNESFADHWGSTPMNTERWRAEFAESSSFRPEQSFIAVLDGEVAGFVLCSEFDADTAQRGYRTGYIARVGTRRNTRGRGIATALLARTLQGLAEGGYRHAELGVDAESPTGAGRLYERAGFEVVGRNTVVGKRF